MQWYVCNDAYNIMTFIQVSNTTASTRDCIVDNVNRNSSILDCFAPYEYYAGISATSIYRLSFKVVYIHIYIFLHFHMSKWRQALEYISTSNENISSVLLFRTAYVYKIYSFLVMIENKNTTKLLNFDMCMIILDSKTK